MHPRQCHSDVPPFCTEVVQESGEIVKWHQWGDMSNPCACDHISQTNTLPSPQLSPMPDMAAGGRSYGAVEKTGGLCPGQQHSDLDSMVKEISTQTKQHETHSALKYWAACFRAEHISLLPFLYIRPATHKACRVQCTSKQVYVSGFLFSSLCL